MAEEQEVKRETEDDLPKELREKMDKEVEDLIEGPKHWLMVKTIDGDLLTGKPASMTLTEESWLGVVPDENEVVLLHLSHVVRYVEMNVPVPNQMGSITTHSITAVRPDLDADDQISSIVIDKITRIKRVDPRKSATEFVKLCHAEEIQRHIRTEQERKEQEMMNRMTHGGLALPGGMPVDPRNLPPHVLQALRRQGRI